MWQLHPPQGDGPSTTAATRIGNSPQNTQCQLSFSVIAAAMGGPAKLGSTQQNEKAVISRWRCSSPKAWATSTMRATLSAPPPKPCTPRIASRKCIDGEAPAPSSPMPKITEPATSGTTTPVRSAIRPPITMAKTWAMVKMVKAQS